MAAGVYKHPADWELAGGIKVRSTGCAQGDMAGAGAAVERRRRAAFDGPWTVLRQVHGPRVVVVDHPGGASGEPADAAVTAKPRVALAVLTADCAPVGLGSPEGVLGVVHAGWKGLRAGVIESAVTTMRRLGSTRIEAVLGPCIKACCYSFGDDDLQDMAGRFGDAVRSCDRQGAPAFDLPAAVKVALHNAGARLMGESGTCTGCSEGYWSWRTGSTPRRQATIVWRP